MQHASKTALRPEISSSSESEEAEEESSEDSNSAEEESETSSASVDNESGDSETEDAASQSGSAPAKPAVHEADQEGSKARRKRKRDNDDLEAKYMQQLEREEAREESKRHDERSVKRVKPSREQPTELRELEKTSEAGTDSDNSEEEGDDMEIPVHESLAATQDSEIEKANRTVFLANVSTEAVTSKSAKKTLKQHMSSFLDSLPKDEVAHKIESIRFRSTAYTNMLPKKASFVTQDLLDTTTHSTNAYVVYSTKVAAREALKLNATVVLDRHLRVDSVAHPAKQAPQRCVFVGNLGFVDDDNAIRAAAAESEHGKKKKFRKSKPGDIEEGLWVEFGKCGAVENVRVVRDSKTRIGKGIAYVQFLVSAALPQQLQRSVLINLKDENSVEQALLYDGKRFPPMLPRKLRVSRAKGMKRNVTKQNTWSRPGTNGVYNPKVSEEQKSALGRASKLLGRAGAARTAKPDTFQAKLDVKSKATEVKAPESFVFEGHRATKATGPVGKKRSSKKMRRPDNHGARRAKAWKFGGDK